MPLPDRTTLEEAAEVVYRSMTPTAQIHWPLLSSRAGAEVWVKHENHTPIGAFKIRGGLVYMDALRRAGQANGVVAATRGNHGQSIALAASIAGLSATLVVPRGNARGKNAAMRAYGGRLIEHGADFQEALEYAQALAADEKLSFVPSFDSGLVAGVASYGLELFSAVPDLDAVYVPIGLGSGICGTIAARDALGCKAEVIGVVSAHAAAYALSFEQGKPVSTNSADTLADGMACRVPDEEALAEILAHVSRVVTVSDDAVVEAMGHYFSDTHNLAEGAGAAPLAALLGESERMAGKRVGLILSGGNVDPALFRRVLGGLGEESAGG